MFTGGCIERGILFSALKEEELAFVIRL